MKHLLLPLALLASHHAFAFCGFYVAKADTKLFNKASQVVLARNDDKTVMTMANDFRGDPKEFAIVIPVPTFLERDQNTPLMPNWKFTPYSPSAANFT